LQNNIFQVVDFQKTKQQLLNWANQFSSCCFLDNHQYQSNWQRQECLVAVGHEAVFSANAGDALDGLQQFIDKNKGKWLFGHLGYDLKNEIEPALFSSHFDGIQFPDVYFFVPSIVVKLTQETIEIEAGAGFPETILQQILATTILEHYVSTTISPQPAFDKQSYIETVEKLRQHILRGDCYEINFCQSFSATNAKIHPLSIYQLLVKISPNPFSCFYKLDEKYLLCASPERYLMKKGNQVFSQPIKGTSPRHLDDAAKDEAQKEYLQTNSKEKSENVMVVDLVRNDLSKICTAGSVKVDELFEVYSYPQVHQLISTISGTLNPNISFTEIIKATFPMGSMTGAPKLKVMQLIEQYEKAKRGLFSGSVGYISPNGDFDFNVLIRSILYNAENKYLSYHVGSGITFYSEPESEYEECMLKAGAIVAVLNGAKKNIEC
jgi:para-aminobenzoate synthetase component 1